MERESERVKGRKKKETLTNVSLQDGEKTENEREIVGDHRFLLFSSLTILCVLLYPNECALSLLYCKWCCESALTGEGEKITHYSCHSTSQGKVKKHEDETKSKMTIE